MHKQFYLILYSGIVVQKLYFCALTTNFMQKTFVEAIHSAKTNCLNHISTNDRYVLIAFETFAVAMELAMEKDIGHI